MRRCDLITLAGGAVAWPLATQAQQASLPVVGYISAGSLQIEDTLRQSLAKAGYVDGRNVDRR
jgi:putative tryptophan/tyrosine transport system substrate-binding protein